MALKDVIGQENAISILQGCIARNRMPHALFFTGDEGIGKRLTAVNLAKALNCQNDRNAFGVMGNELKDNTLHASRFTLHETDSCDRCPSCTKIENGNHPDVYLIESEGDGDQITVSAIRELEESLTYKPFEGRYKIAIIDNSERMNPAAANAFLDTLESPPLQSVLILVSSRPDMLLPTIRSRCQKVHFNPLPLHVMSGLLREKFKKIDEEQAHLLSALSGGRLGYALNENLIAERDRHFGALEQMLESFGEAENGDMEELLDWAQIWLRDLAVFRATGRADLLMNSDREGEIKTLVRGAALKGILKLARELYNIRGNARFNLNEKLTRNYIGLLIRKRLGRTDAGKQ
jgi:DNA polymerase-3 subunit delta'